jgi:RHS repeat-associated protein
MDYRYRYDAMDNITEKATEHGTYQYGYDELYRLTEADNPTLPDESYTYDGVGNRLTSAEHSDWSYNANNELQGYDAVSFAYDANGNTVEKNDNGQITRYNYNLEDRLSRVEDGHGALIAEYYYDPFGRRLWKDVDGGRLYFVYSDEGLVGEINSEGLLIKEYGFKPNSLWTTDPLFLSLNGQYYFYQNDHLGKPHQIISISGAHVWIAEYNVFGKADINTSIFGSNRFRFPGQYYDKEIDLSYNFQRYYYSITGNYLSKDPLGLISGINLYAYAYNNPLTNIDYDGQEVVPFPGNDFFEPKPAECTIGCDMAFGRVVGFIIWQCCDESGQMYRHKYQKRCGGPTVGVSVTVSSSPFFTKEKCTNPPLRSGGAEFSISPGAGSIISHGGPIDNESAGVGVAVGPRVGAAWCYYELLGSVEIDGCCDN